MQGVGFSELSIMIQERHHKGFTVACRGRSRDESPSAVWFGVADNCFLAPLFHVA